MTPFSRFINEQPLGELDMPPIRYELASFESWYRELDARGGGPMLSINRRLGFRLYREECTYQLRRDALAVFLRRSAA